MEFSFELGLKDIYADINVILAEATKRIPDKTKSKKGSSAEGLEKFLEFLHKSNLSVSDLKKKLKTFLKV
ncbi:hypothetical protein FACS189465_3560 [Clostridia bacterium]|nr:hypothetical protein FACS189465_3560 [Clostridia bacterium]